jgi:hypothetical protein
MSARRRLFLVFPLVLALADPSAAADKDATIAVNGTRMFPLADMKDYVNDRWGIGAQLAWPAPSIQKDTLIQLGIAWINFEERQSGAYVYSQDYWRFWIGPRWDIPVGEHAFQPYLGLNLAAVRHSSTSANRVEWSAGWDVTLGADYVPWRGVGVFGGFRYLQSYGLDLPRNVTETVRVDPEYFEAFGGLLFTFSFLGLELEDAGDE